MVESLNQKSHQCENMGSTEETEYKCTAPQKRALLLVIVAVVLFLPGAGLLTGFSSANSASVYVIIGAILLALALAFLLAGIIMCCMMYQKCDTDMSRANMVEMAERNKLPDSPRSRSMNSVRQEGVRPREHAETSFTGEMPRQAHHPPPVYPPEYPPPRDRPPP